tara:strand:+ start:4133 stop:5239 length:1107 start_codon:yes stop_codon:yes gene_type:complete
MAHFFVYPEKDATIVRGPVESNDSSKKNTGLDEILEVGKTFQTFSTSFDKVARSLIQFDISTISASVSDGTIASGSKFYLNMYDAGASELNRDQTLYAYATSQSWDEGDGKFSDTPQGENGVSWRYRTADTGSQWGHIDSGSWGSTYFSGSEYTASQTFNKNDDIDMRMDVTNIVNHWISGSISNEGFLIKRADVEETGSQYSGLFKFFSSDTHTVFQPRLEAVWDDSVWSTGSLDSLTSSQIERLHIRLENFRPVYKKGSLSTIRVKGREQFPARTHSVTSSYQDVKTLPSGSSYYSIVDTKTDQVIIPFGTGSVISCDSEGNYFNLRTEGLEAERFYKVEFKIESGSGINKTVNYFDGDDAFKVER